MSALNIASALIAETIDALRSSETRERVVLWLGRRHSHGVRAYEVFVPMQETEADYFRIPHDGMEALFRHMRPRHLMVAAQVHTHPGLAFHSAADDRWAIVRHQGGLSFVVPCFCQRTTAATFVRDAKIYQLDEHDKFVEVAASVYEVTP